MARLLDRILVVDLEATCWDGPPPAGEMNEIIEIGLATLDLETLERGEKTSLIVRPERSRVSSFCTELTTLTQEQVDEGMSFAAACEELKTRFRSHQRTWASFGDYDRRQVERQCALFGVPYPFGATHLNVKNLLALGRGLRREVGLDRAMKLVGLPLEGTHHRGHDDAWNIAAVLATLLRAQRG